MNEADIRALIERYIASYNAFDVDGMLAVLAPDIRFENYSGDELTASAQGADEFRKLAEHAGAVFAEREQQVTAMRIDGHTATVEVAYRGRLATDIPDGPPAGTVIELDGRSDFLLRNGLIEVLIDRS